MSKSLIYLSITIGGAIGGYLPILLFHAGDLSIWSVLGTLIGSLGGIYVAYKISN